MCGMRIAATYDGAGGIFQHFGKAEQFKIFDVEGGRVASAITVDTEGGGHIAQVEFLKNMNVNAVICGGIGEAAQQALKEAGIELYAGVTGQVDAALKSLFAGMLSSDPKGACGGNCGFCSGCELGG